MTNQFPEEPANRYGTVPVTYVRRNTNGLAIASLVLGIVWAGWVGSILAVIFGHISLKQIKRDNSDGRGMAIAGLVLGYIGLATLALFITITIIGIAAGNSGGHS